MVIHKIKSINLGGEYLDYDFSSDDDVVNSCTVLSLDYSVEEVVKTIKPFVLLKSLNKKEYVKELCNSLQDEASLEFELGYENVNYIYRIDLDSHGIKREQVAMVGSDDIINLKPRLSLTNQITPITNYKTKLMPSLVNEMSNIVLCNFYNDGNLYEYEQLADKVFKLKEFQGILEVLASHLLDIQYDFIDTARDKISQIDVIQDGKALHKAEYDFNSFKLSIIVSCMWFISSVKSCPIIIVGLDDLIFEGFFERFISFFTNPENEEKSQIIFTTKDLEIDIDKDYLIQGVKLLNNSLVTFKQT